MEFIARLFDTSDFSPRWTCGNWTSAHGWLHVLSDLGVWSAYVAIPCVLLYFLVRRQDLPFRKIFLLFGAFILACGTTHLMEAIIFWWPAYRLAGLIKLLTALVSWGTVIALVPIVPRVLTMRSAEELETEIAARLRAEAALRQANDDLERLVKERTEELTAANAALQAEIAERRRAEETQRAITDNATTAIFMVDEQGRCTFMNPAAEAMIDFRFDEARGKGLHDLIHHHRPDGSPYPQEECPLDRVFPEGIHVRAQEDVFIRKSGQFFPVVCHARPIRGSGAPPGTVVEVRDITREKDAERRIYGLLTELREADRKKNDFLALLAHELRNPLAPIRNALLALRLANGRNAEFTRMQAIMERQVNQLVRLVDDLLDVSRITRNKLELRREPIDLANVIQSAVETSRPLIEEQGHELAVTLPPHPLPLYADLTRLAQVFANLLNNAAKYTERGGRIGITAEREGGEISVAVSDNGVGMAPDVLPRVFDMFTQGEGGVSRSHGGLGIGLTLVQRLVEMHGGSVAAHSAGRGHGSTFVVRLPVAVAASPPSVSTAPPSDTGRRRILVVDDNQDAAVSLALMLNAMGHETRTASDGLEAVQTAAEYRPEVILLDIGMPRMNGLDACRRIREQEWGKAMVIAALTGWGQEADKRRSREAGFDHHFTKPVNLAALAELLASIQPSAENLT